MRAKKKLELRELSIQAMDIVGEVAGRRLVQILEQVFEEEIAPLHKKVAKLEAELRTLRERLGFAGYEG
jgi:hypothetical protein